MPSKIEWTQQTWNPTIGCSKVSSGCRNCYAETMAARLAGIGSTMYYNAVVENGKWNGKTAFIRPHLDKPLKRKKPTIWFVGSMTDIFHPSVEVEWLDRIFDVISRCPQHRFIILTKRPEAMQAYMLGCQRGADDTGHPFPWVNVILGVTAENQEQADKRIPVLLKTPAAARFVSIEPMLGAVDLQCIDSGQTWSDKAETSKINALRGWSSSKRSAFAEYHIPESTCRFMDINKMNSLDWVICGGESGPGARPMHPDWARALRDQCAAADKPFFFKQWGAWAEDQCKYFENRKSWTDGKISMFRNGKKANGNLLDGQVYEQYPEILREVLDV